MARETDYDPEAIVALIDMLDEETVPIIGPQPPRGRAQCGAFVAYLDECSGAFTGSDRTTPDPPDLMWRRIMKCGNQWRSNMRRAYVGNIPFEATEGELRRWFAPYTIKSVQIMRHKESQQSRGFAFVEFASEEEYEKALFSHNGQEMNGRKIVVNDATKKRG